MKIEIKSIYGNLLFEGDFSCIADAVSAAVKAKTNLRSADLRSANLRSADLRSADLRSADLRSADLRFANLRSADLRSADLRSADLRFANLRSADLRSADLRFANLRSADLRSADLSSADLRSADLSSADLRKKDLATLCSQRTILPEGDLIGYKKLVGGIICKLRIPADAARVGGLIGRKCRAEFAVVLEGEGRSSHNAAFEYKIGATVRPEKPFDDDPRDECKSGIHFFITRAEAEAY